LKLAHSSIQEAALHTGEGFESTSKFLIGNRFHITVCIVSPTVLFNKCHESDEISLGSRKGLIPCVFSQALFLVRASASHLFVRCSFTEQRSVSVPTNEIWMTAFRSVTVLGAGGARRHLVEYAGRRMRNERHPPVVWQVRLPATLSPVQPSREGTCDVYFDTQRCLIFFAVHPIVVNERFRVWCHPRCQNIFLSLPETLSWL